MVRESYPTYTPGCEDKTHPLEATQIPNLSSMRSVCGRSAAFVFLIFATAAPTPSACAADEDILPCSFQSEPLLRRNASVYVGWTFWLLQFSINPLFPTFDPSNDDCGRWIATPFRCGRIAPPTGLPG